MKRTHNKLLDNDEDMDNLPLKYISSNPKKHKSLKELRKYSVHACEFCEKKFDNSYDYLIHNAKHIIIPLIKMLPHHCADCGVYFITDEEMNEHLTIKHKTFIEPKISHINNGAVKNSNKCKLDIENVKKESNEDEIPLTHLIKKEKESNVVWNNVTENILRNFVMNCKVDVEKLVSPCLKQDHKSYNVVGTHEDNFNNHVAEFEPCIGRNNIIQNNVVSFEDNIKELGKSVEENSIIKSKNPPAVDDPSSELSDLEDDPIVILAPVKKETETELLTEHNTIHYDDLMKPGIYYCKRCLKRFPNRYEVIVHELVHLDMSNAVLESYKRKDKKHSYDDSFLSRIEPKHVETRSFKEEIDVESTFELHCTACALGFSSTTLLKAHEAICNGEAVVNMCDQCLYFRKRPKHIQYYSILRFTKEQNRVCHWCGELCDVVSLVTLVGRSRLADRIKFEGDSGERDVDAKAKDSEVHALKTVNKLMKKHRKRNDPSAGRGSKHLSNRERLKLIQQRLKSMKKK